MQVVITGITGFRNRGVEALADTAITQIGQLWPEAKFTIVTTDPAYDASRVGPGVRILRDSPSYFRQAGTQRMLLRALAPRRRLDNVTRILRTLREADLVFASGGDIFSSDYGTGLLRRQLGLLEEAQRAGRPTAFLAHSIGPFKTKRELQMTRPVLQAAALVTVRESFTRSYLLDAMGLAPDKVVLTSDVAFLLPPCDPARARRLAALSGIPPGEPYIALGPSEGITSFSDVQDRARHDQAWVETVQHLLRTTAHRLLLVPHVQDSNFANDDAQIAFRLMQRLGFPERLHMAAGPLSARDFKGLIAGADFFVGERMHACIAALSSRVPLLVVGYSVKARGIMQDVFDGQPWAHSMVSVADFVGGPDRATLLDTAWNRRAELQALLQRRMPVIQDRAALNFRALRALFATRAVHEPVHAG